jgi:chromosome segregation ATPase
MSEEITLSEALSVARGMANHYRALEKVQAVLILAARAEGMVTDAQTRFEEFGKGIAEREAKLTELVEAVETQTKALAEANAQIRRAKDDHLALLSVHASKAQESLQATRDTCREVERASQKRIAEAERQQSIRMAAAEEDYQARRDGLKQEEEHLNATLGALRREIETLRAKFA